MKIIRILFLVFANYQGYSQLNMDSLVNTLQFNDNYRIVDTIYQLMEPFVRFETLNRKETYDVYFDSSGKLGEYIGLSAVYEQFDDNERIIKRVGYNKDGKYYLWDFSPIETRKYLKDSIIIDSFNSEYFFSGREIIIFDRKKRVVEIANFSKDSQLSLKRIYEYNDIKNELLVKEYDGKGSLKSNELGVAIHYIKFEKPNSSFIIEERFYDSNMKLVDANHAISSSMEDNSFRTIGQNFSILKRVNKNGKIEVFYYDSNKRPLIVY